MIEIVNVEENVTEQQSAKRQKSQRRKSTTKVQKTAEEGDAKQKRPRKEQDIIVDSPSTEISKSLKIISKLMAPVFCLLSLTKVLLCSFLDSWEDVLNE